MEAFAWTWLTRTTCQRILCGYCSTAYFFAFFNSDSGAGDGLKRAWALYWAATRPDCSTYCSHDTVRVYRHYFHPLLCSESSLGPLSGWAITAKHTGEKNTHQAMEKNATMTLPSDGPSRCVQSFPPHGRQVYLSAENSLLPIKRACFEE